MSKVSSQSVQNIVTIIVIVIVLMKYITLHLTSPSISYLQFNDIVSDGGAPVRLGGRPGQVAVVGAPVQDVGSSGL